MRGCPYTTAHCHRSSRWMSDMLVSCRWAKAGTSVCRNVRRVTKTCKIAAFSMPSPVRIARIQSLGTLMALKVCRGLSTPFVKRGTYTGTFLFSARKCYEFLSCFMKLHLPHGSVCIIHPMARLCNSLMRFRQEALYQTCFHRGQALITVDSASLRPKSY